MICQSCRAVLRTSRRTSPAMLARASSAPLSTSCLSPASRLSLAPAQRPLLLLRTLSTARALRSSRADAIANAPETPSMSEAESAIADILASKLSPTQLLVQDVSGGCGSMYAIDITSPAFKGLSILKQQRMVNAALGDIIKGWHGVQLRTKVPEDA